MKGCGVLKEFQPVVIEDVYPELNCGRYPVERGVGDRLEVWADVFKEGHDVIFLAEAFTRPKVMKFLAKFGFTQSYTYYTWRNYKAEIVEYLTELTKDWPKEYMRPNFFADIHDILPHVLQFGGRPAFIMRLALAATLSPTYGIYNGYELCENTPRGERGTTVYHQDSEVYEYKVWDWERPGHIKDYVRRINEIRHENPALRELTNLDPHNPHDTHVQFPLWELGIGEGENYVVEELVTGRKIPATGSWFWVRPDPGTNPVEIFRLQKGGVR